MLGEGKKNAPSALATLGTQGTHIDAAGKVDSIVTCAGDNSQEDGQRRFRGRQPHTVGYTAKVYSLAIKCYDEQLPLGAQNTINQIRATNKAEYIVIAIRHDRDEVADGIWLSSVVKPHWHFIIRCVDKKSRVRVSRVMEGLGIVFRRGIDDSLWRNHGVETVGNFAGYAMYLTHETEEAIRDAKELYDESELISNLTPDEVADIRAGYIMPSETRRLSAQELVAMDRQAYNLGLELKPFGKWYGELPFSARSATKMRTVRESYNRGVEESIEEQREINRLCVFIQGDPNTGKTYAANAALAGRRILAVGGGGTGKFDRLTVETECIIVDDDICPNAMNMTDNYICFAYKRRSDNPAWTGDTFIVTSNLEFDEWVRACGVRSDQHMAAMHSRFFICRLVAGADGVNHLGLISPSTRGSLEAQQERLDKFRAFKNGFDRTIAEYRPSSVKLDYSDLLEFPDDTGCTFDVDDDLPPLAAYDVDDPAHMDHVVQADPDVDL